MAKTLKVKNGEGVRPSTYDIAWDAAENTRREVSPNHFKVKCDGRTYDVEASPRDWAHFVREVHAAIFPPPKTSLSH